MGEKVINAALLGLGTVGTGVYKVLKNQGAGSGRRHWDHYVPYYWISDGADYRIYGSYFSEVRSRQNG